MTHVVCIGVSAIDIKAARSLPLRFMDSSPGAIHMSLGGVARNMAENFARLECSSTLLSVVGADVLGRYVLQETAARGVETSDIQTLSGMSTTTFVAFIGPDGTDEYAIYDTSIVAQISAHYLESKRHLIQQADVLVTHAVLPIETLEYLSALAETLHVPLYVNATTTDAATRLLRIIHTAPILGLNRQEAETLVGGAIHSPDQAMAAGRLLVSQGARASIITLDKDGAVYCDANRCLFQEAFPAHVVDATGAGDALCSAFLAMNMAGHDIDTSLRYGLAAAAITIENSESSHALISREALADRLKGIA